MRRPAQLTLPGRGGSAVRFCSTLATSMGRLKVIKKARSSAPTWRSCQLKSRTRAVAWSPERISSPRASDSPAMTIKATRSRG